MFWYCKQAALQKINQNKARSPGQNCEEKNRTFSQQVSSTVSNILRKRLKILIFFGGGHSNKTLHWPLILYQQSFFSAKNNKKKTFLSFFSYIFLPVSLGALILHISYLNCEKAPRQTIPRCQIILTESNRAFWHIGNWVL